MASDSSLHGSPPGDTGAQPVERYDDLAVLVTALFSPLAHDLRAGLNGISVWTHLLARDGDEVGTRALEGIRRAVTQQSTLAQELSQFGAALVAQRAAEAQVVDLDGLCRQAVDDLSAAIPGCKIALHVDASPAIVTHAQVLQQAVRLLLLDAVAAWPEDAGIELRVHAHAAGAVIEVEGVYPAQATGAHPRRRSLRQSLAALAAALLGGRLDILPGEPGDRCVLHLPLAAAPAS
jgi:signal transduction histidine kinase